MAGVPLLCQSRTNEFIFGYEGLDDPIRIKERLSHLLAGTLRDADFSLDRPGLVGTHSIDIGQESALFSTLGTKN